MSKYQMCLQVMEGYLISMRLFGNFKILLHRNVIYLSNFHILCVMEEMLRWKANLYGYITLVSILISTVLFTSTPPCTIVNLLRFSYCTETKTTLFQHIFLCYYQKKMKTKKFFSKDVIFRLQKYVFLAFFFFMLFIFLWIWIKFNFFVLFSQFSRNY